MARTGQAHVVTGVGKVIFMNGDTLDIQKMLNGFYLSPDNTKNPGKLGFDGLPIFDGDLIIGFATDAMRQDHLVVLKQ